jgi:hypothetical protein
VGRLRAFVNGRLDTFAMTELAEAQQCIWNSIVLPSPVAIPRNGKGSGGKRQYDECGKGQDTGQGC